MDCPIHKSSMSQMGSSHYEANGDVFTYYWCRDCEHKYEVIEDALYGGPPEIKPC